MSWTIHRSPYWELFRVHGPSNGHSCASADVVLILRGRGLLRTVGHVSGAERRSVLNPEELHWAVSSVAHARGLRYAHHQVEE